MQKKCSHPANLYEKIPVAPRTTGKKEEDKEESYLRRRRAAKPAKASKLKVAVVGSGMASLYAINDKEALPPVAEKVIGLSLTLPSIFMNVK